MHIGNRDCRYLTALPAGCIGTGCYFYFAACFDRRACYVLSWVTSYAHFRREVGCPIRVALRIRRKHKTSKLALELKLDTGYADHPPCARTIKIRE